MEKLQLTIKIRLKKNDRHLFSVYFELQYRFFYGADPSFGRMLMKYGTQNSKNFIQMDCPLISCK